MAEEKILILPTQEERLPSIPEDCTISPPKSKRSSYYHFFSCTAILVCILLITRKFSIKGDFFHSWGHNRPAYHEATPPNKVELVFSTTRTSNLSWVNEHLGSWHANFYRLDDPHAPLSVPTNKGGEAMAYLTYIIDRYRSLPEVAIFVLDKRYIWSNDNPLYDNVISIIDLRTSFVQSEGYVNLRCALKWGCPAQLEPAQLMREKKVNTSQPATMEYPFEFMKLFPRVDLPEVVGTPTGNQFAVSREKILERPREDYIRYRQWLMETSLEDEVAGKILEYSWHMIFGKPAQHCLNPKMCYCRVYGHCDLNDSEVSKQWVDRGKKLPSCWPGCSRMSERKGTLSSSHWRGHFVL